MVALCMLRSSQISSYIARLTVSSLMQDATVTVNCKLQLQCSASSLYRSDPALSLCPPPHRHSANCCRDAWPLLSPAAHSPPNVCVFPLKVRLPRAGRGRPYAGHGLRAAGAGHPTPWTIPQRDGPNHLGLRYNSLPEHQMAPITSDCVRRSRRSWRSCPSTRSASQKHAPTHTRKHTHPRACRCCHGKQRRYTSARSPRRC